MSDLIEIVPRFLEPLSVVVAVLGVVIALVAALRAGVLKRLVIGPITLEGSAEEVAQARALISAVREHRDEVPFETEQLARYYAQVLAQSKVSFWFSLLFASLGFLVIIAAAFMYTQERQGSTIASFVAGLVIDAVASLFFVQSKNAQKAMGEFFDKLRKDREQAESRTLCENIEDREVKDALRVQLSLYYAGIPGHDSIAKAIIDSRVSHQQRNKDAG